MQSSFRTLYAALLFLGVSCFAPVSSAQEGPYRILHKVPKVEELPPPGTMVPLTVEVRGSKDVAMNLRLVAARDGKMMDIGFPMGVLSPQDVPVFELQVPAPSAYMSYQFVIRNKDETFSLSPRFLLKRACIQTYRADVAADSADAEFRSEVGELYARSRRLEAQTVNYETALKIINDIKKVLDE